MADEADGGGPGVLARATGAWSRPELPAREVLRRRLAASVGWVSALDGGLLSGASWRRRHLLLSLLALIDGALTVVLAVGERHGRGLWPQVGMLVVGLAVSAVPALPRRARVVAIVLAYFACAMIQNRYVGNLSTLSGGYVVLLSVYQDWLPILLCLIAVMVLPFLAVFSPDTLHHWRAFEQEAPGTGALTRTLGIFIAAGVTILVWRANGVATRDGLTGLATRDHAERRLRLALRNGRGAAVLVCDVDAFRLVADDLPRAAADGLIRDIGQRLRQGADTFETVLAAGGGATYVLVHLGDGDAGAAETLARDLCEEVARAPFLVAGAEVPLTVTIGVAVGGPGDEAPDLLRAADLAMHRAKGRGAAAIGVADQAMHRVRPRGDGPITAELRRAVERDEFVMHYQPLVDLRSGRLLGAEALVRWQHPTRGLLGPGTFLPYTETHPWLNAATSRAIASQVFHQAAAWGRDFPGRLPAGIALNLAPSRLADPALRDSLAEMLVEAGADPAGLVVELTEGAIMDLEIDVSAILGEIADLGVRIGLDDFGTGHSSLAHLRDFPLHEVKIDRSFVDRIVDSTSDRAVVRAVLAISSEFGAEVVVEGIERPDQRAALLEIPCDAIGQGFLFARPMPAADFTALVESATALPTT